MFGQYLSRCLLIFTSGILDVLAIELKIVDGLIFNCVVIIANSVDINFVDAVFIVKVDKVSAWLPLDNISEEVIKVGTTVVCIVVTSLFVVNIVRARELITIINIFHY